MKAHSSGLSGSPYSPIQLAPASRWLKRLMSSSGEPQTMAPKRSGRRVSMLPIEQAAVAPAPRCRGAAAR